ncbi:MAG: hypothetical protein A2539_08720 [Elusimicrobia bacterium RIFOXYD2_FULL_34_15]|nr:MAG: hypothetical protein A2539_08720 [Elusimicrobia bacterium RIFOXYD2_FULL_34_15]
MVSMPSQKMLVVEIKGDPNNTGKLAISELYKTLFILKKTYKEIKMAAPRSRWPKSFNIPKEEWVGLYGIPVSDTVEKLPEQKGNQKSQVKIAVWEYGEVAEILHIGPYSEENSTVEILQKFIKDKGYKIIGDHEEDYIKGPGMIFKGNPKKYYTIIRYRVKKK